MWSSRHGLLSAWLLQTGKSPQGALRDPSYLLLSSTTDKLFDPTVPLLLLSLRVRSVIARHYLTFSKKMFVPEDCHYGPKIPVYWTLR